MDLTGKQVRAISLLVQGLNQTEVANEIKVSKQTLTAWAKNHHFQAILNREKMEVLESTRTRLQHLSATAATTVEAIIKSGSNDSIRLKAALEVLKMTGFDQSTVQMFAWGIGKTSAKEIEQEVDSNHKFEKLLSSLT